MAGDHTGNWDSTKSVIRASAAIPAANSGRPYGWKCVVRQRAARTVRLRAPRLALPSCHPARADRAHLAALRSDMDMLETGCGAQCAHANGRQPNMTDTEWRTEFSMWAISASPLQFTAPLMNCTAAPAPPAPTCAVQLLEQHSAAACTLGASFGCDAGNAANNTMFTDAGCRGVFACNGANVTCDVDGSGRHICACASGGAAVCTPWLSDLQKEILLNKEVIAINQDVTPQGRPVRDGDISVWSRMLSDGSAAVALYNENDAPMPLAVAFADLGWPAGTSAAVRDLWAHADLGAFTDRYPASGTVVVTPHESRMLRITKQ